MDDNKARDGQLKKALDICRQRKADRLKRCGECGRELDDDYHVIVIQGQVKHYCEYCFITLKSKFGRIDGKVG